MVAALFGGPLATYTGVLLTTRHDVERLKTMYNLLEVVARARESGRSPSRR